MVIGKSRGPNWSTTKSALLELDRSELIRLVGELYRRDRSNRDYLHTRFALAEDALKPYRATIEDCLYPNAERNWSLQVAKAKRAISDYKKAASNDKQGTIELMVYFVERGTQFSLDYQFMDERFVQALVGMYRRAVDELLELPEEDQERYWHRLRKVLSCAEPIGWGYNDALRDEFFDSCPEKYLGPQTR